MKFFVDSDQAKAQNLEFLNLQKIKLAKAGGYINDSLSTENISCDNFVAIDEQLSIASNFILTPQNFPSEKGYQFFSNLVKDFKFDGDISPYIGLVENDPHLARAFIELFDLELSLGAQPKDQRTSFCFSPSLVLFFGTGDGSDILESIKKLKPYNICIAVKCWEDLESSFETINWMELWNEYCLTPNRTISIIPYQSLDELRSMIIAQYMTLLEHCVMLVPKSSNYQQYCKDRSNFVDPDLTTQINYLGFVTDEYNMIWNSAKSLSKKPRIYEQPSNKIGGNYVVCGSGPSLDENIENIRYLSETLNYTIIACASNYRTLRQQGINVDILCLLERGSYEYDNYREVKEQYGTGNTILFASVTCDDRLHSLFVDSAVFFRPALTPVSLFSTKPTEVLFFEGPQTVNTGVALCNVLKADQCILIGVDLGAINQTKVRSESAAGTSQRNFDLEHPGNFEETVLTTQLLLDGKFSIEKCISKSTEMNVYNASNGIKIENAKPLNLSKAINRLTKNDISNKSNFDLWWSSLKKFEATDLKMYWLASRPRVHVSNTIQDINSVLSSEKPCFKEELFYLNQKLTLDVSIKNQLARRIIRAFIIKQVLSISRQCYVLIHQDSTGNMQQKFVRQARQILIKWIELLEVEIYALFDKIETELDLNS